MSAGLNFCVRATLRLRHFGCPSDTDVLKISSLSKWASSESRYEPPCAKLASCLLERHYTVLLKNSCPAAARFLRTPIKADTKSIGHILCSDEHPERRSRSVARTQKLSPADIFANSIILSKIVFSLDASHRVSPAGARLHYGSHLPSRTLCHDFDIFARNIVFGG